MEKAAKTAHTYGGEITEAQIEGWKQKHGKVARVDVVDGEDTHIGYFHRPSFETIKAVTKVAKSDEVEAGKIMFDNCWLGGSDQLRKDPVLFMAVQQRLAEMLNVSMSSIKNL